MENLYIGNYKNWVFTEKNPIDQAQFSDLKLPEAVLNILFQRGLKSPEAIKGFLNPDLSHLHDPFLLEGMTSAVERILQAIQEKQKILIYGDYDVDGVTATSILVHFLKQQGLDITFYIPDRVDEGYGISETAVDYINAYAFDLVITVDCGITARFQVDAIYEKAALKNRSIDVIITDHHQFHDGLMPDALAVINPHLPNCQYPFKHLCGAGIALKLVQAIGIKLGHPDVYTSYLDLAALATIADVVDLVDENRIIVKYGLAKINQNACLGIKALLHVANPGKEPVDSFKASFLIAPRVNAAGRMGDAKRAVSLFTTQDEQDAMGIALDLNQINIQRQEVQDDIFKQAVQKIENDEHFKKEKVLVVSEKGWHHGVIGIVASKLVDRFHKPAFVLSAEGDKVVGSGRSIEGFNLFHCMEALSSLLIKFGGHAQAGGLTLMAEDLDYFRERINAYAKDCLPDDMMTSTITINARMAYHDITIRTAKALALLEPFGQGNGTPALYLSGVALLDKKLIGNGKHLRLKLEIDKQSIDAIWFNKGDLEPHLQMGDRLDIVFNMDVNAWQGREYLQLRILDMRLEEPLIQKNRFLMEAAKRFELLDCDNDWLYNGIIDKIIGKDDINVVRDDLIAIYRYVMKKDIQQVRIADLFCHATVIQKESGRNINFYKLILALFIFDELDLLNFTLVRDGSYELKKHPDAQKVNLEESELFSYLQSTVQSCG